MFPQWDKPVVVDFETYYDGEYSLSKITTEEYIRSDKFECIGVSVKVGDRATEFYPLEEGIPIIRALAEEHGSVFVSHNCLTGDHEVRTEVGWVRLDALVGGEKILQWDPSTSEAEFVAYRPFSKPYSGTVYRSDTSYHKGVYTEDHRMYYHTPANKSWRVASAKEIAARQPNSIYLPVSFVVAGSGVPMLTEDEVRLLEAIRADGWRASRRSAVFHVSRSRKIDRLKQLAVSLGLKITVSEDKWHDLPSVYNVRVVGDQVEKVCNLLGKDKLLGDWVLSLPISVRRAWVSEIEHWDGTRSSRHRVEVSTASRNNAHWLSELAMFSGYQSFVDYDIPNNRGYSTSEGVLHRVVIRSRTRCKLIERPSAEHYNGTVYCVSVPSGAFVVRRGGKTWITGNCNFDMGILGMRYNIHPAVTVDTVTLARLTGADRLAGGRRLYQLANWLPTVGVQIPPKGTAVENMKGVHAADMTPAQWADYAEYCKHDSEICYRLYCVLMPLMSTKEILTANFTTKMWTFPVIDIDRPLLEAYYAKLEADRDAMFSTMAIRLGLPSADDLGKVLRSRTKFPELLEAMGVEVPMKWSEKQQKNVPALAKTDKGFLALLEHYDPMVAELAQLRLDASSTIAMTRTKRFIETSTRGLMPVPLRYAAAHTGRYGGMDGVNCFTPEHEVLTPTGWVRMDEYEEGTPIMQWWEDGRLSFDHNPAWLAKPYSGDVYEADSPMASFRVTPDHRISYVRYGRLGAGMVTKTVEALFHSSGIDNIPVDGMVDTPDSALTTAEIRYMVALQADGSLSGKNRHTFGFKKTRKIERFRELMAATGFDFREVVYDGVTTFVVTPEGFCNVNNKNFGPWILSLSARQLTVFCDELVYWDGNENSNNRSMEYNSTIKENVLWVDTAMRLCGRHSSIYELDTATVCGKSWRLYERTTRFGSITPKVHMKKSTYEGMVYCPKVDSDMILVRHGLKIFVSNQCQNLPKRSNDLTIRRSMRAPKDCVWVAADSSQIEARLIAYAAGQQDLVDVFTSGRDVYVDMATKIYGESYDDIMAQAKGPHATPEGKKKRNVAKEVVLACVAEDTEVLTDSGWVAIQDVPDDALLWDGEGWVSHEGLVFRGEKDCVDFGGVLLTPDHLVFDGEWKEVRDADDTRVAEWAAGRLPDTE